MSSRRSLSGGRRLSTSDEAYDRVRRDILDGSLMPGDVIVEERVAKTLNMSRTPVREALLRLERENLLERTGRSLSVRTFSGDEIADIYSLRAHIESYGARLAAERVTDYEIEQMARVQADMVRETEAHRLEPDLDRLRRITQLNQRFHQLVIRAARSPALERTVSSLVLTPLLYRAQLWYDEDNRERSAAAHDELLAALRDHDRDRAERLWHDHLLYGRDIVLAKLATDESGDGLPG
ncbi:MAG: GntR family transcriptional regulator [Solirubrobacteraceae bacterium]|nr:GntR family transcriptional regulator [Solirubrobacteraceae bacterium]